MLSFLPHAFHGNDPRMLVSPLMGRSPHDAARRALEDRRRSIVVAQCAEAAARCGTRDLPFFARVVRHRASTRSWAAGVSHAADCVAALNAGRRRRDDRNPLRATTECTARCPESKRSPRGSKPTPSAYASRQSAHGGRLAGALHKQTTREHCASASPTCGKWPSVLRWHPIQGRVAEFRAAADRATANTCDMAGEAVDLITPPPS